MLVDLDDAEFGEREAVARERDRRLQCIAQRLPAVGADQLGPAGKIARRRDRHGAALQILAPREPLDRQRGRHKRHEIERPHPLLFRDVAGREAEPGKARHERLDHVERRGGGRRRIEGVSAARQHFGSGLRGQRMSGGHDAVQ